MIPFTYCAQTLELFALVVDIASYKLLAKLSQFNNRDVCRAADACFLSCLKLCGQTVSIPAGNIRSLEARHVFIAYNKVLKDLIERVAQMNITVCIRRSVVKHKQRLALVKLHQLFIEFVIFPFFQHYGFALWKSRTHRKLSLGKIKR